MFKFRPFNVAPRMPENLTFLQTLANNVWWSWVPEVGILFSRINPRLFKSVNSHPRMFLARVGQERLLELSQDESFLNQMRQVQERFEREVMQSRHWKTPFEPYRCVAYFSLEYGLHESIRLYSGGLGVLAGDHLKSSSDLDLPLVAVGLLYRHGYFEQQIDAQGQQKENYPENDLRCMPVTRATRPDGSPIYVSIPLPEGRLQASVWCLAVGRIPLYLLDTNTPENPPDMRDVTGRLYGGDRVTRLRQELLLGVGGMRALKELGYQIAACHMNEGHAAFLGLERMRVLAEETGQELETVRELVRSTSIFTTHTPVPAGNETFEIGLVHPHLKALENEGGVPADLTLTLGRAPGDTQSHEISMTILGLNLAYYSNGVSRLHGDVEKDMWQHLWPDMPRDEVPIGYITNGIHVPTWISPDIYEVIKRVLGPDWEHRPVNDSAVERISQIPEEELWRTHELNRTHLIRAAREHIERRLRLRNASPQEIAEARSVLDQDVLTIGFARRFATYKRADLILQDMERLLALLTDRERPVQLLFAGKAHPADWHGKELIHRVTQFAREARVQGRIVFLEDYDMNLARQLVRGVDVWLNTPRRPNEASGTSGMKVCINGGLHLSSLDGWWHEGYTPEAGWAIGNGDIYSDEESHDIADAQGLYNLLETEVVPTFYDRPAGGIPMRWINMMKASMQLALRNFSSHRMVSDYMNKAYEPALEAWNRLSDDNARQVAELISHRRHVASLWPSVQLQQPTTSREITSLHVGDSFNVSVQLELGNIDPRHVMVEVYYGVLDSSGSIVASYRQEMKLAESFENGRHLYRQTVVCHETGRFGFTARVLPRGNEWRGLIPGYITWANWND